MSSSMASYTKSSGARIPDVSSAQEFPDLAPSTKQLDLTPRPPMAPTPLAHIFPPKSKPTKKSIAKPMLDPLPRPTLASTPAEPPTVSRPSRCTDTHCPVAGYHHHKIYTCGDRNLPVYVKELIGRAEKARACGANHAFNEPQKKLDRFFYMHSGFFHLPPEGMGEDREMVYGPFETSGARNGWQSYLLTERT
ncbi:hypothetical protein G7Y79_00032g067020 [Physcia stellaris]|nr:hypothetical protein G7Y79_00032g067020 [Physcia stellaris]